MMSDRSGLIRLVYDRLLSFFGPQNWWPAETPFEVIVGAILTQNTAWKNIARASGNLRAHGLLSLEAMCAVPEPSLAELVRPSGYYNQKARKLKAFCRHVHNSGHGGLDELLDLETDALRSELLQIRGVGPETADSVVLYAAHKPSFVVDTYTHRIFSRHGWVPESSGYDELRDYFMDCLEPDVEFFQELHALLVRTGHLFCRKTPLCGDCPLNGLGAE